MNKFNVCAHTNTLLRSLSTDYRGGPLPLRKTRGAVAGGLGWLDARSGWSRMPKCRVCVCEYAVWQSILMHATFCRILILVSIVNAYARGACAQVQSTHEREIERRAARLIRLSINECIYVKQTTTMLFSKCFKWWLTVAPIAQLHAPPFNTTWKS